MKTVLTTLASVGAALLIVASNSFAESKPIPTLKICLNYKNGKVYARKKCTAIEAALDAEMISALASTKAARCC